MVNRKDLREFIIQFFSDPELDDLCFDYYPDLLNDFTAAMSKSQKVRALISYAERRGRMDHLLVTLDQLRTNAFRERFNQPVSVTSAVTADRERDPARIFLSYAHQDVDFARRLAADLRRNDHNVWVAPDSIEPGEKWVDAINRGLETSGVFVLIVTDDAANSKWVRDESGYAIALENKDEMRVITLDVGEGRIPPLWGVRQHIPFRDDYDNGLRLLLAALRPESRPASLSARPPTWETQATSATLVQEEASPGVAIPTPTGPTPSTSGRSSASPAGSAQRRAQHGTPVWAWLFGVVAVVAVVALAVWAGIAFSGRNGGGEEPEATAGAVVAASTPTSTVRPTATSTPTPRPSPAPRPTRTPTFTPTPEQQAGDIRVVERGGVEVEQVYVPAGSFMMGSEDGSSDERPVHEVTLDAFWIDRTEVTNAQYRACVLSKACASPSNESSYTRGDYFDNDDYAKYPVIHVDWKNSSEFCRWAGGRLPTEAEWEYTARGSDNSTFPWGKGLPTCNLLNYGFDCVGDTSETGAYLDGVSWVGALDLAGNVWEWVADWYSDSYYSSSPRSNPTGPESGEYRVMRGGSWGYNNPFQLRASYRNVLNYPHFSGFGVGFRCAQE